MPSADETYATYIAMSAKWEQYKQAFMPSLIPAAEAARRAGLNRSSVARRCQSGKVPGAVKVGNVWCIPADVVLTRQTGGWPKGKPRKETK